MISIADQIKINERYKVEKYLKTVRSLKRHHCFLIDKKGKHYSILGRSLEEVKNIVIEVKKVRKS